MVVGPVGEWSVERIRTVTARVGSALEAIDPSGSADLVTAARLDSGDAEALLAMRSALVSTRSRWETSALEALVTEARGAIAAGKRLAIDLD
jgi:uncharacterized membrane protein